MKKLSLKTKERLKSRGYVVENDGTVRKKTVLEKYFEKGYLDLPNSQFSAEDRKKVGEKLAYDYYLSNLNHVRSVNLEMPRIKSTGEGGIEGFLFHQQRYLNALKSIPYEFLEAVRIVCIEDRELGCDKSVPKSGIKSKYNIYYRKMLLTLGLERLVKYYLKISKNSS
ncbi:MAG: hypothetical protein IJ525_03070 [Alphaproteobacteria bacterium]|nr:hypothetical protein [Alphaproteobacteria bacterium]